eukprot:5797160-Pleurochrysis_carterae.AAC.1
MQQPSVRCNMTAVCSVRHLVFVTRSTVTRRAALLHRGVATLVVPSVASFRGAGAVCFAAAVTR